MGWPSDRLAARSLQSASRTFKPLHVIRRCEGANPSCAVLNGIWTGLFRAQLLGSAEIWPSRWGAGGPAMFSKRVLQPRLRNRDMG
jgi:hypothetical protein